MATPSITFESKVWEGDWRIILTTGRLKRMIDVCRHDFDERILYVNNVNDRKRVLAAADKYLKKNILTSVVFVDDIAQKTLEHFKLRKEDFKGGYYYSIQELAGIYNCRTEYLLHFSGDSIITGKGAWIDDAIERMEKDPSAFTANPKSRSFEAEALLEKVTDDGAFHRCFGFSDQCYLIRADDFKKPIYNETHEASKRYPKYGGELFEKRVDSYMRNHGLYRLHSMRANYRHQNFPTDPIRRMLVYLTGINLKKGHSR